MSSGQEHNPSPVLRLGHGPLVGRGRELAVLAQALDEMRAGHPGVVLIAGEPGIGKSRLLEEFPVPAQARELIVLRGGASQADGMPPYLPLVEALGEYVALAPPDVLRTSLGAEAAVLTRLLPELPVRLGGTIEPAYPIAPEQEQLRLYEAVAGFLGAIATMRGGLMLSLDDLPWADAASCQLLDHVARRLASRAARVLI